MLQEGAPSREKSGKNEQEAQGIENSHDYAAWAFSSVSRPHERRRPLPLDASVAAALSYSSVRSAPLSLSLSSPEEGTVAFHPPWRCHSSTRSRFDWHRRRCCRFRRRASLVRQLRTTGPSSLRHRLMLLLLFTSVHIFNSLIAVLSCLRRTSVLSPLLLRLGGEVQVMPVKTRPSAVRDIATQPAETWFPSTFPTFVPCLSW